MDNGIYVALSKQLAQFRQMAVIANNIANAETTGYGTEKMLFDDYLVPEGNKRKVAFTQDYNTHRNLEQGKMKQTGNQLDMAIMGKGYFVVDTPNGPRYTRAGNFQIDGNGILVTPEGYPVLGEGGEQIQFQEEDTKVEIREEGFIIVDGEDRGRIEVVDIPNEQLMEKVGKSLYKTDQAALPIENPVVAQGVLEGSNVEPVIEITDMMMTMRRVGNTSQFIDTSYELERRTIGVLAKQQK